MQRLSDAEERSHRLHRRLRVRHPVRLHVRHHGFDHVLRLRRPSFRRRRVPDAGRAVAHRRRPMRQHDGPPPSHTDHNNDWGSLFGIYGFGPRDESAYDGLSFWARAPGDTTKAFTILLDDTNTENLAMPANCSTDAGTTSSPTDAGAAVCKNYCMPDGGTGGATPYIDSLTGMVVGGTTSAAPPADACGNEYYVVAQVTGGWQFYTFPFANFRQLAEPNRVPNAHLTETGNLAPLTYLLTSALMGLTFRMPPEADMNLWLSHLGFYRPKAGGDGAVDAPKDSREQ